MIRIIRLAFAMSVAAGSIGLISTPASAQAPGSFEVGAQIPIERVGELDATDAGIGVRAAWLGLPLIGVEGELNVYPSDVPDDVALSGSRTEGLFGVTAGPRLDRWRPFVRFRTGFLHVGEAPEPIACPAIFPPTTSCLLAGGDTLYALDLGGGIEYGLTDRTFARFDIGDRMVRYPGPSTDRDFERHDDDFVGHDLRVAFGAGWKF